MKTSYLISILGALLLLSCGQLKENDFSSQTYNDSEGQFESTAYTTTQGQNTNQSSRTNPIKLKPYKVNSQQFGMVFGMMPIPKSWEVKAKNKENILFESSNGVKVYGEQFNSFFYSNNYEQNQFAQQNGNQVKAPKSVERLINEDIKPFLEKKGIRYVGQFPLPQLAQLDKRFNDATFKATPENKQFQCVVTEWEDGKGNKSIGIIRYFTAQYTSIGGMNWGYTINALEAPEAVYEQGKKDYINALINFQYNPNWLQANNQHYAQLSRQSTASHNQRMAAIKAQGQAAINTGNTYSSIADSNHESWKRRNGMTDAGQAKAVDGIWERSNMQDQNGNEYQVEGYSDNVWVNNNDEYIGTDNTNWNPNIDTATYYTEWEPLQYTDDNY